MTQAGTLDPELAAKAARLRYVNDEGPGITRKRDGESFTYWDVQGGQIQDEATLDRIRALGIPPAWENVWICPLANGHIQATGRDAKGRKQYRYHLRWRAVRDETKYAKLISFATALPKIRETVEAHLAKQGLPREKVLATIVRLLEVTCIRVGNEEYARKNRSFGLTTLRNRHVDVSGSSVRFTFRGKSGKSHAIRLRDRQLARIITHCSELPGHELFQYVDDEGERRSIESADVNAYIKEIAGDEFTAKDFRTWVGTVSAVRALRELGPASSGGEATKQLVTAVKMVAQRLGNTPAVCRKSYIHPAVVEAWLNRDGSESIFPRPPDANGTTNGATNGAPKELVVSPSVVDGDLDPDEIATLEFLRKHPAGEDEARALRRKLLKSIAAARAKKSA
jgi:DNA topoisomerase-1